MNQQIKGGKIMIYKYVYGNPFDTEAVTSEVPLAEGALPFGSVDT